MRYLVRICILPCILLAGNFAAKAQFGTICGDPSQTECTGQFDGFKPFDLIFNTGRAELTTNSIHESDEFYAVVLESIKAQKPNGCAFISETKRKAAQKLFLKNKVFASREYCGGTIVRYSGVNDGFNFMAIYAGATEPEAAKILAKARKKYPSANIRKMQVRLDFADE